jgi:RimJ/RimL family protein N-acetyltransferase
MSAINAADFELIPLATRHKTATLGWMNDLALMPVLNRLQVITGEEHERWFASLPTRQDLSCFAIEAGTPRRHVGNIWLNAIEPIHRRAEIRIMLAPCELGRGLGSGAIVQLAHHAFRDLGLHRLTAYVLKGNSRGQRAFEKAGFTLEATLREDRWTGKGFVDVLLFARLAPA